MCLQPRSGADPAGTAENGRKAVSALPQGIYTTYAGIYRTALVKRIWPALCSRAALQIQPACSIIRKF